MKLNLQVLIDEYRSWFSTPSCEAEDEIITRLRKERFTATWIMALASICAFSITCVLFQSTESIYLCIAAFVLLGAIGVVFWKFDRVLLAARMMVGSTLLLLFGSSFIDGQAFSETLWLIGLAPMMASYLLSRRCWLFSTIGAGLMITLTTGIFLYKAFEEGAAVTPTTLVTFRTVALMAYCGAGLFATLTGERQVRELRKRDEELEQAYLACESAIEAKNRFLANMSHEIRTPMHGILGTTAMLKACGLSPQDRKEVDAIGECGEALLRILNNILDISKIDAGKFQISPKSFDPQAWIESLQERWAPQFTAKGLEFQVHTDFSPMQDWVADQSRLNLVLDQLFHNALRFTEAGRVRWTLALKSNTEPSSQHGHSLMMQVSDSGRGVSLSDKERIFDVFERDDGIDGLGTQGMGLGLAICRKSVNLMGGTIHVFNNEEDQGACFALKIPVGVSPQKQRDLNPLARVPARGLRGLRVLVVDDQELNLKIAQSQLRDLGCKVSTAANGEAALEAANQSAFDIILMDLNMPKLDGWRASKLIHRESAPNLETPIIALTAESHICHQELRERGSMVDHLPKPFSSAALRATLARHAKQD